MKKQRESHRVITCIPAILVCRHISFIDCVIRNLNHTGFAVDTGGHLLELGQRTKIMVGTPNSRNAINAVGRVIHSCNDLTGLEWLTHSHSSKQELFSRLVSYKPYLLRIYDKLD